MAAPEGNKNAETGPKLGRPPIWDDPEAFDKSVEEYFSQNETAKTNPTWTGLALHLGFVSRQSLEDYKSKEDFSYSIKKALAKIEENYEQGLFTRNPAGAIFALKNFGWRDTKEIKHDITQGFLNVDPLADDPPNASPPKAS